jgi:HSP20 family molecular chaperone IbpA
MTTTQSNGSPLTNASTKMETPMTIVDTIWEPHTVPIAYLKPSTLPTKTQKPETHHRNLVHSVHTHLPWHQRSHGAPPAVCPETDIRETAQAYHIEMALAGVSDKSSISIEWHAPRTLVVAGGVASDSGREGAVDFVRPPVQEKFGGMLKKVAINVGGRERNGVAPDGHVVVENHSRGGDHSRSLFILKERRVGVFQRTFTMPVDVAGEGCRATLEYGLLRIDIPKRVPQEKADDERERLIGLHDDDHDEIDALTKAVQSLDNEGAGSIGPYGKKTAYGDRVADGRN